jgi:hypothetical protein
MSRFRVKNPDEIVLEDIKMWHYESLSHSAVWMGVYLKDGKMYHMTITGQNLQIHYSEETPD